MRTVIAVTLLFAAASAFGQVHVRGYTKKDGTYVAPHERTAPNHTNLDNYSTKGNINPYTGKEGTKEPDYGYQMPPPAVGIKPVQSPQPIQPPQPLQAPQPIQAPTLGRSF